MNGTTRYEGAPRVVLADADPTIREALRDLAVQGIGMQVAGEASDLATLRELVETQRPDVVLIAWKLVSQEAASTLRELRGGRHHIRIVVLGPRPDMRRGALAAGADAFISLVDAPDVVAASLATAGRTPADTTTERRSGMDGEKTHEPRGVS